jgi:2,3-bisphosphoglycerate-dependent phosphoglycerate mutase
MKRFHIIRHGESLANKGERTERHDTIPLTEDGKRQAEDLAKTIAAKPDLIIVSPFTRTHETALPLMLAYPDVPVETWDVHEFTYLDTKKYNGTTREERQAGILSYWERKDIHYRDAEEVESYAGFIRRLDAFLDKISQRQEENILVFSHGNFIYALKEYLKVRNSGLSEEEMMQHLMNTHAELRYETFPISNASIHEIIL